MTDFALILLVVVALPWLIGWLHGRNDVDPNTPDGRKYYAGKDTKP